MSLFQFNEMMSILIDSMSLHLVIMNSCTAKNIKIIEIANTALLIKKD